MSSQEDQNYNSYSTFTGLVLVLTFVVILGLISVGTPRASDLGEAVASVPSSTPEATQVLEARQVSEATQTPSEPTEEAKPTFAPITLPDFSSNSSDTTEEVKPTFEPITLPDFSSSSSDTSEATATEASSDTSTSSDTQESASADAGSETDLLVKGSGLFVTCSACHGMDAKGVTGLGKNLVESEFVHSLTDAELVNFISTGRPSFDAANTTGIDMPAKGGNPTLTDNDLYAIVAYIRSLK